MQAIWLKLPRQLRDKWYESSQKAIMGPWLGLVQGETPWLPFEPRSRPWCTVNSLPPCRMLVRHTNQAHMSERCLGSSKKDSGQDS